MYIMINLNNDSLYNIINIYIKTNIDCVKKIQNLRNLFICKEIWNIVNGFINKLECKIINMTDINLKICNIHDNVNIEYIDKIKDDIKKYKKYMDNLNINQFMHCKNIQKNETITNKILKNYGLKIKRYCCNGNGCELTTINITK